MNNDLISRNKLIENLPQPIGEKEAKYYIKVVKEIDNAPTVKTYCYFCGQTEHMTKIEVTEHHTFAKPDDVSDIKFGD